MQKSIGDSDSLISDSPWATPRVLVAQRVKHLPAMQETRVQFLGWEDPLEKEMATHSCLENSMDGGALQSMGSQRVGQD